MRAAAKRFAFGEFVLEPAQQRLLRRDGTQVRLTPRLFSALCLLVEHAGELLGKEWLMQRLWPGLVVEENNLSQVVSGLRRALGEGGQQSRLIETVPRLGFRFIAPVTCLEGADDPSSMPLPSSSPAAPPARRGLLLGIALGAAGLAGMGIWVSASRRRVPESALLVERARAAIREDRWGQVDPLVLLDEAIQLDASDASAWGLTAIATRDLIWTSADTSEFRTTADCTLAARRALELDPDQPEALVALATAGALFGDWLGVEARLAPIAKRHPRNEAVLASLRELYAATGRSLEHLDVCSRAARMQPHSPRYACDEIRALWASAQHSRMDDRAEAAVRTWPNHAGILRARAETLGFTGRAARALDFIVQHHLSFDDYPPKVGKALFATFRAYAGISSMDEAINVTMEAGSSRQSSAAWVFPMLSSLGATRQAFELADSYFLARGPIHLPYRFGASQPRVTEMRERSTEQLFLAPAKSSWTEPRFVSLCGEIGLIDYWRASGTRPHLLGTTPFAIGS